METRGFRKLLPTDEKAIDVEAHLVEGQSRAIAHTIVRERDDGTADNTGAVHVGPDSSFPLQIDRHTRQQPPEGVDTHAGHGDVEEIGGMTRPDPDPASSDQHRGVPNGGASLDYWPTIVVH